MMFTRLLPVLLVLLSAGRLCAGVEQDWSAIVALDAGPSEQPTNEQQARSLTFAHLAQQQRAYENFLKQYPDDPRAVDVKLRMAHLLSVRAATENNRRAAADSRRILDQLAKDPSLPAERRTDVAFARIALFMKRMDPREAAARKELTEQVVRFQTEHPDDRRLPALLVELATLYDSQPVTKRSLLQQASRLTRDEELKLRIADDLRRVELLGRPVELRFRTVDGETHSLEEYRGRVVVLCFFADFSPPSIAALKRVQAMALRHPSSRVQPVGISLDQDADTLRTTLRAQNIRWPVAFDGRGWESPMVRGFGINVLPTVWVLDPSGALRTLNASDDCEARVRELLRAKP